MADRHILYKLLPFVQGQKIANAADVENDSTDQTGVVSGASDVQAALNRVDGTGVGADFFQFTGPYAAQASNIDEWFNNRQVSRMRCISASGASGSIVPFTLPGATALGTAFDALQAAGLAERIEFILEYTGVSTFRLQVTARAGVGNPVITGTSAILIASGIQARVEITRTGGVISDYVHTDISQIAPSGTGVFDALKFQNPASVNWDASATGTLPTTNVVKGNAYKVFNAPADGSGRFGEVMADGDWVVWEGETFTAWATEPHAWFVIPAHQVRRITALEQDFLQDVAVTSPVSDRNGVVRGADYSEQVGEIRLKIYPTVADYSAADLNTTGDIDEYTNPTDITGYLAIRLQGTAASLASVLPTLFIFAEDGSGNFTELFSVGRNFRHLGDFGAESDYISNETVDYTAGDTIRIYLGTYVDRYNIPNLDVSTENLADAVQQQLSAREPWADSAAVLFSDSSVFDIHAADRVEYSPGYALGIDWRDMAESTTINENRYIDAGLTITVNLAAFTINGFGNTIQKIVGIRLQRNDGNNGEGAMVELGDGQPLIRVNTSNEVQVNTNVGSTLNNWASLGGGSGAVTLGSGNNNFLIFEMVPRVPGDFTEWELVGVFFDGTNYTELNNINFTPTGAANGDNMGFSRSSNQRGQILEFKAINSPGYLTHSALDSLLRQHRDDKWDFGYARLIEGATSKGVVLRHILLQSANGSNFALGVANDGSLTATAFP